MCIFAYTYVRLILSVHVLTCRLDNLVIDLQDSGRVLAVLDWELSTLGHPFADLAYNCMPYHLPSGIEALPSLPDPLPAGMPPQEPPQP